MTKRPGSGNSGLAGHFPSRFIQLPGGKEVRGGGGAGAQGCSGGSGLEGLKSWGPEAVSPANRGCSRAGDWRAAAAPLAPSPRSRWPETPSLPTKNSWARPVPLGFFKCGAAAARLSAASEVSQKRGFGGAWVLTGRNSPVWPRARWKVVSKSVHGSWSLSRLAPGLPLCPWIPRSEL